MGMIELSIVEISDKFYKWLKNTNVLFFERKAKDSKDALLVLIKYPLSRSYNYLFQDSNTFKLV